MYSEPNPTIEQTSERLRLATHPLREFAAACRAESQSLHTLMTTTNNLAGRRVIPGQNDSHLHVIRGGLNFSQRRGARVTARTPSNRVEKFNATCLFGNRLGAKRSNPGASRLEQPSASRDSDTRRSAEYLLHSTRRLSAELVEPNANPITRAWTPSAAFQLPFSKWCPFLIENRLN